MLCYNKYNKKMSKKINWDDQEICDLMDKRIEKILQDLFLIDFKIDYNTKLNLQRKILEKHFSRFAFIDLFKKNI